MFKVITETKNFKQEYKSYSNVHGLNHNYGSGFAKESNKPRSDIWAVAKDESRNITNMFLCRRKPKPVVQLLYFKSAQFEENAIFLIFKMWTLDLRG